MSEKKAPDWERIELDYRAGMKTLRQIADEHGLTHGAINKRAKRDGWVRDLSAKIAAKADELVSKAAVSDAVSKPTLGEREVVAANAHLQAEAMLSHREDVRKGRALVAGLMDEVESNPEGLALPQRVDCVKKLSDAMRTQIELERKVLNIDQRTGEAGDDEQPTRIEIVAKL